MTRSRHLLLAVPLGAVAAVALWLGDARLTHRDWLAGAVLFGLGLAVTFLFVRELRRGGLVR
jgi:NO-binding membrane sensor protein with MHYT domain